MVLVRYEVEENPAGYKTIVIFYDEKGKVLTRLRRAGYFVDYASAAEEGKYLTQMIRQIFGIY